MSLERTQTLDKIVIPICRLFGWEVQGTEYSWVFMGLKGFLIGLLLFPYGLILAVLWPLSYYIGLRLVPPQWGLHEWLSGAGVGMVVSCGLVW